jgi:hypothetical protein
MTSKEAIQIRRLAWLCGELRAGNAFSEATLWQWEREAQEVLHASAGDPGPLFDPERQFDLADRKDL